MIDRLVAAIKAKNNPTVAGLDPTLVMIPDFLKEKYFAEYGKTPKAVAEMFIEFNKNIIDDIADIVPAIKPQIAMYEKFGLEGLRAYNITCEYASSKGLIVIGDIKRGDISSTAAAYAAHIGGADIEGEFVDTWCEDAVTINPYMGSDGIKPFLDYCEERDKGLFILVKTSNPSSREIQDLVLLDGRTVFEQAGELVSEWGENLIGQCGYSKIGAVVGATHKEQGNMLREAFPHMFFLVPGYGAQGAGAEDVAGFFDTQGLGAIINSSRGITAAYKKDPNYTDQEYAKAARAAAIKMREDLQRVL